MLDSPQVPYPFVVFRKAFDSIDHKILLDKLQLFGICGSEHPWMSDCITDRTQPVFVGGVLSCPQQVVSRSILGPLLFSLYVTDLPKCLPFICNNYLHFDDKITN